MANYDEQVVRLWDEWELETGAMSGDPSDFIEWAVETGRLQPSPQDVMKLLRRRVTTALRQVQRFDEDGMPYRGKQCAIEFEDGRPMAHWFDTDTGGTPRLRSKAIKQRRDAIANDVYRAKRDRDHMNAVHSEDNQFVLDFTDDCAEREALDALSSETEVA